MVWPVIFIVCLLASPAWAFWAVRGDGSGNDSTCTNQATVALAHANGCETFTGFLTRSSGTGRLVNFQCGITHRVTGPYVTDGAGDAANPIQVGMYGEGGGASCASPAAVTHAIVASGWTQCTAGAGCPITDTRIYRKDFGFPVHEWGLAFRAGNGFQAYSDTNGRFDRQSFDKGEALVANPSATVGTCPTLAVLAFDQAWCQPVSKVPGSVRWRGNTPTYLRSDTGHPDTRWPGQIEVILHTKGTNPPSGNILFDVQHPYWYFDGRPPQEANNPDYCCAETEDCMKVYMPTSATFWIEESNIQVRNMSVWGGGRGTIGRHFRFEAPGTEVHANLVVSCNVIGACGRDCFDLGGTGHYDAATLGGSVLIERNRIFDVTDHHVANLTFEGSGTIGRRRQVLEQFNEISETCGGIDMSSNNNPPAGSRAEVTGRNGYIYNTVDVNDTIVARYNQLASTTHGVAECNGNVEAAPFQVNNAGLITLEQYLIRGGTTGDFGLESRTNSADFIVRDSTIVGNGKAGVRWLSSGGDVFLERSIVAFNGTGAVSLNENQFRCDGNPSTNARMTRTAGAAHKNIYYQQGAAAGEFARCDGTNMTVAEWDARTQVSNDSTSVVADPLFVNLAALDFNLQAGSPARGGCTGAANGDNCGGLQPVTITNATTIDANTVEFAVTAQTLPIVVNPAGLRVCRNVGAADCTAANDLPWIATTPCTVQAGGASVRCDTAQNMLAADVLKYGVDYAGIQSGPVFGIPQPGQIDVTRRASILANLQGSVTNTLTGGAPSPISCTVANNDPDAIVVVWDGTFLPANCTGFTATLAGATWPQSDCDPQNTTQTYIDFATNATAGQAVLLSYSQTGNATVDGVEPAALTDLPCDNQVLPTGGRIYVNTATGDDAANDCTEALTPSTPKQTITGASGGISCLATGGGTVEIAAGTYAESINDLAPNGTSYTQPILITGPSTCDALDPGTRDTNCPILQPAGAAYAIYVAGANNANAFQIYDRLILDGTNSTFSLVRIEQSATRVRLSNSLIRNRVNTNNGMNLAKPAAFLEVINVEIADIADRGIVATVTDSLFERLFVHDIVGRGIELFSASGNVNRNTVSQSVVRDTGGTGIFSTSGDADRIVNNIVCNTTGNGIEVGSTKTNAIVEHNSVGGNTGTGILVSGTSAIVRNNAVFGNTVAQITPAGDTTLTTNISTDPLWVDAPECDLHLSSTSSPAYNTGTTLATVTVDQENEPRPQDGAYDVGALEGIPPDTIPPVILACPLDGTTLPGGTTSTPLACTTNEAATCRWDTTDVVYASMANTFSTTGATSHSTTLGSLTDGNTYTRYVRCIDGAANAMLTSQAVTFSVAFPSPTLASLLVTDAAPGEVRVLVNHFGSSPIAPASGCTGLSCQVDTGGGFGAWTINSCALAGDDTQVLTMASSLTNGDLYRCSYSQTGNILNAAGQELVAFTDVPGTNAVDPDIPDPDGSLAQAHARFRNAEVPGALFTTPGAQFRDGGIDSNIVLSPGGVAQVFLEFSCSTNACASRHYVPMACDNNTNCGQGEAGWYALATGDFGGRLARFANDSQASDGAVLSASLSGCTLGGGFVYESPNIGLNTALAASQCGVIAVVWQFSPLATAGNTVRFGLARDDLTQLTRTVTPVATFISGQATR